MIGYKPLLMELKYGFNQTGMNNSFSSSTGNSTLRTLAFRSYTGISGYYVSIPVTHGGQIKALGAYLKSKVASFLFSRNPRPHTPGGDLGDRPPTPVYYAPQTQGGCR